jgi:hypothetical protein
VGKKAVEGMVEVEPRAGGEREDVPVTACAERLSAMWDAAR